MKQFLTHLFILLAAIACTPDPEPEGGFIPEEPVMVPVQSVELSATSLSLLPGEKAILSVTVRPDNATVQSQSWSSSDESVAIVSQDGEVSAIADGTCVITADYDGKKATCDVTVSPIEIPVTSVSLDISNAGLLIGETLQLTATVFPDNASDKTVTWSSSNTDVATVENGLVSALGIGEATITATAGECSASCTVTVTVPFNYDGMCLESVSNGYISISNPNQLTIEYKVENADWQSSNHHAIWIETKAGERVWFRGNNETYTTGNSTDGLTATNFMCYSSEFYLYGNLMSLLYGDEFASKSSITGEYAFFKLFSGNGYLVNHPSKDIVLPATTLSGSCYRNMFSECVSLTRAPELPAMVLAEACYASMFAYCSSLKEFPEMAATDMASMSCTWMMMGSGIEKAPELPAMNLAQSCYEFMFSECPNLTKGPAVLPATELATFCYTGMFQRCEKLEEAPALPATELKYS